MVLLDEPTNALDCEGVRQIYTLIKKLKKRGAIVVIATHHKEDLREMCDVSMRVHEGKLMGE